MLNDRSFTHINVSTKILGLQLKGRVLEGSYLRVDSDSVTLYKVCFISKNSFIVVYGVVEARKIDTFQPARHFWSTHAIVGCY